MKYLFIAVTIVAAACSLLFLPQAGARGAYEAGRAAETFEGPRGGEATVGEFGGVAVQGAEGGEAVRGPYGAAAAEGPNGGEAVRGRYGEGVAVGSEGGVVARGPYGVAAEGPEGNVLVAGRPVAAVPIGTRIAVLPETAVEVAAGNGVYYVDGGVYYQACEGGYCVAEDPNGQDDDSQDDGGY